MHVSIQHQPTTVHVCIIHLVSQNFTVKLSVTVLLFMNVLLEYINELFVQYKYYDLEYSTKD